MYIAGLLRLKIGYATPIASMKSMPMIHDMVLQSGSQAWCRDFIHPYSRSMAIITDPPAEAHLVPLPLEESNALWGFDHALEISDSVDKMQQPYLHYGRIGRLACFLVTCFGQDHFSAG